MRARVHRDDRGASVVEFVLLSALLVLMLFAVLQVAVWFYARTVVASAASGAAHFTATLGGTAAAGEQRARELLGEGLSAQIVRDIACVDASGTDARSGLPITTVRCRGNPRMLVLPFDLPLRIDVRASVLTEQSP